MSARHEATPVRLQLREASRSLSPQASSQPSGRLPSAVAHGSLADGMTVCLGLLAREPDRFEAAAVAWYARWCTALPGLSFGESRAALSALEALMGPEPSAGARALSEVCRRYGLGEVAAVLDGWLERQGPRVAALQAQPPRGGPTAA